MSNERENGLYATDNIFLAAYIKAHDFEIVRLDKTGRADPRGNPVCDFVFDAKATNEKIAELEFEWNATSKGKTIRRVLSASKAIRAMLKDYLASGENLEMEARDVLVDAMDS